MTANGILATAEHTASMKRLIKPTAFPTIIAKPGEIRLMNTHTKAPQKQRGTAQIAARFVRTERTETYPKWIAHRGIVITETPMEEDRTATG